MANSLRPTNHAERATCAAAVARVAARTGLHPAIATLIAAEIEPVTAAFELARGTNDGAALKAAKATDDKNAADAVFAAAFRRWLFTAYAVSGEAPVLREVKPLLDGSAPARWLQHSPRNRLEQFPRLALTVGDRPELTGDPACLWRLRDAATALEAAVTAWEAAIVDWGLASDAAALAAGNFDRSYGALVRTILAIDPHGAAGMLPVFHRAATTRAATRPTRPAPPPEPPPAGEDEPDEVVSDADAEAA